MNKVLSKILSESEFNLEESSILIGYRGSITHGTYVSSDDPDSIDDKDVMGICIPPKEYYFGLPNFEQAERMEGEWDIVVYSLKKYMRLLLKNNPNVMSLLWLKDSYYLKKTPYGQRLIDQRDIFSSKLAYKSFSGYAWGQLHRMTHGAKQGYMGEKRKRIVEKYGFDVKNASHLIRLLKMGIEFLTTGELQVARPEAQMLMEIKKGLWTLDQVKKMADNLFQSLDSALISSKLKNKPDHKKANELLISITEDFLRE